MRDIANQLCHLTSHDKVVEYLKYSCKEHKIKVKIKIKKDKRHSSAVDGTECTVLKNKKSKDNERDEKKECSPERRISRSLFKSSCRIINAYINVARYIGGIRGD